MHKNPCDGAHIGSRLGVSARLRYTLFVSVSPYLRLPLQILSVLAIAVFSTVSLADKDAFKKRWDAMMAKSSKSHMKISMSVNDDPAVLPGKKSGGYTVVSNSRSGFLPPPAMLSPEDISSVVSGKQIDIRNCYKKQLKQNSEWADRMILDIAIKKTGRVGEVDISPGRVKRDVIGKCLMRSVPKWRFPEFTGSLEDGIQQDVMNASVPFSFGTK